MTKFKKNKKFTQLQLSSLGGLFLSVFLLISIGPSTWAKSLSTRIGVGVESSNFVNANRPTSADAWTWNNFIEANWQTRSFLFHGDAGIQVLSQKEVAPVLPELYFRFPGQQWNITIGRERRAWSKVDEEWMLGQVQPRWMGDIFRPRTEGLTGLFFDFKLSSTTALTFYFSGVHVPDRGPNVDTADGRFESLSPWFVTPPSVLLLGEGRANVVYKLNKPSVSDVISQFSAGLQLMSQWKTGFWQKSFYLFKPSNQFFLPYSAQLIRDDLSAEINVFPETRKQTMAGVDFGYDHNRWGASLSTLKVDTDNRSKTVTRTKVEKSDLWAVSPSVYWRGGSLTQWKLSLFQRWGGDIHTIDSLADASFLPSDSTFKQAWRLEEKSMFLKQLWKYFSYESIAWTQDLAQNGDWVAFSLQAQPSENITVDAGFDFIGVHGSQEARGLLTDYALYDRWRLGVTYVF